MSGEGGYHDAVAAGGITTSYAVVPSCDFGGGTTPAQQSTISMSHELIEASTDPHPPSGYTGFDTGHFAFTYFQLFQAEVGDACELFPESLFEDKESSPAPFDAWVQRTWSNAGGAAGHDPCVPAAAKTPYFNVTPLTPETVDVTVPSLIDQLTGQSWKNPTPTQGIHVPATKTVTFPIGFYSDGPTGGPWSISVSAGSPILKGTSAEAIVNMYNPSSLTVSVDKTSGQNGEKANVAVTVKSQGTRFAGEIVTVTSTLGGVSHYMPIWIGN